MDVTTDVQFVELLFTDATGFPLVVVVEALAVNQHLDYHVSLAALDEVFKLDAVRKRGLGHVHELVL